MVVCDGQDIGKPRHAEHAREILLTLSGKTHQVFTGITILDIVTQNIIYKTGITEVTFKTFPLSFIDEYISSKEPFGKAGAYSLQGNYKNIFVQSIQGEITNALGLPKNLFLEALDELQYKIIEN
jgi:septum formation protein